MDDLSDSDRAFGGESWCYHCEERELTSRHQFPQIWQDYMPGDEAPTSLEERRDVITKAVAARKAATAARKAASAARKATAHSNSRGKKKVQAKRVKSSRRRIKTNKQAAAPPSAEVRRSGRATRPTQRLMVSYIHT